MNERKIVSSDSHVIEPPEMWREYITPKMRDRAPRLEHAKDDDLYWIDGLVALPVRTLSTAGVPSEITKTYRRWDAPRLKGGWDPVIRVKDIERDKIDAEVIYSTICMKFYALDDGEYRAELFNAYNRWMADFCKSDPKRYLGIAVLATENIEQAVKDLGELKKMGFGGAALGLTPAGLTYASPEFDPLWAAAQDMQIPLSLHNFTQGKSILGKSRFEMYPSAVVDVQYFISSLMFNDVFERFPKLKIVSVENDIGWIANYLQRADQVYSRYSILNDKKFKSGRTPTQVFREHVFHTFTRDMAGIKTYELWGGLNNIMWASDYPHGDSSYPDSGTEIERQMAGLSAEHRKKILRDNVLDLYNWH